MMESNNMLANVFKIVFISMILMFLIDITVLTIDFRNTESRVNNISEIIQKQVIYHNGLLPSEKEMFDRELEDIKNKSIRNIVSDIDIILYDKNNNTRTITNIGEYGERAYIDVIVTYRPLKVFAPEKNERLTLGKEVHTHHKYSTPFLRYLN